MKVLKTFITLIFFILSGIANAQYSIGGDIGIAPSFSRLKFYPDLVSNSNISCWPRFSLNYLRNSGRRLNWGLSSYWEFYSVGVYPGDKNSGYLGIAPNGQYYLINVHEDHRSSFIYFCPTLDYRIYKKRLWHFLLLPSIGFNIFGSDTHAQIVSRKYVSKNIFRMGFQLQRDFQISPDALITASLGYSFMTGTLTSFNEPYTDLRPQVFSLSIGYMKQFKKRTTSSITP